MCDEPEIISLSAKAGELMRSAGFRLAVAESCTGGLLGGFITAAAGSSDYFSGGVICYANRIKRDFLGVPVEILDKYGAVSSQVAKAMADGICRLFETECGISVSGIAGPGGGRPEKPVGLVYIGVRCKDMSKTIENRFTGDREQVRLKACRKGLEILIEIFAESPEEE
jgi:PncC family amidohydrolase